MWTVRGHWLHVGRSQDHRRRVDGGGAPAARRHHTGPRDVIVTSSYWRCSCCRSSRWSACSCTTASCCASASRRWRRSNSASPTPPPRGPSTTTLVTTNSSSCALPYWHCPCGRVYVTVGRLSVRPPVCRSVCGVDSSRLLIYICRRRPSTSASEQHRCYHPMRIDANLLLSPIICVTLSDFKFNTPPWTGSPFSVDGYFVEYFGILLLKKIS